MSSYINELRLPLQKIINLGQIDQWLRGMSSIAPRPSPHAVELCPQPVCDLNTHITHYTAAVEKGEIEKTTGFRQLLQTCARNNVKVNIESTGEQRLRVHFEPSAPFSKSTVFGVSYANLLPLVLK